MVGPRKERRRHDGAVSYLRCGSCQAQFAIAGRRRLHVEMPEIELVVCPHCNDSRQMALPTDIGTPFRVIGAGDQLRDD